MFDPARVVRELRELQELTGDGDGAQREAWSPSWLAARNWLVEKLADLPVAVESDEAGNLWAKLPGDSTRALAIGGHIDSVPNGGWLDGCLGTLAGLEIMRRVAAEGTPAVSMRLVDFADEEGTRFGRSLFGSSCASGNIDLAEVGDLRDRDGVQLRDAVLEYGVDLDQALDCSSQLEQVAAYIELHIEQGPVLEDLGLPVGVVLGMYGVERWLVRFTGRSAHESWPWEKRRDSLAAAARLALAVRDIAQAVDGFSTVGSVVTRPGFVTAVPGECELTVDQRNFDAERLARMFDKSNALADEIAGAESVEVEWERLWSIPPTRFDPELIELADKAVIETVGECHRLPSGPLHDAAEVARAGVPSVMLFVQSINGISHNRDEDSHDEHIELAVRALDALADKAMRSIVQRGTAGVAQR
jgi:hydantoinase/carbamoylase family amidase